MFKNISILFIYTLLLLVKDIYSIDFNIKEQDINFKVRLDANMLVKKEKVLLTWTAEGIPENSTYTIDLLTNSTYNQNGFLTCAETYTIVNNLTLSSYKWKTIKLNKYNIYSFMVTVENENKYGLSKTVPYVPDFWKYIKKGNQTLYISNGRGENVFNKNVSLLGMVDSLQGSSTDPDQSTGDVYYATIVADGDGNIYDTDGNIIDMSDITVEGLIKGKSSNNYISEGVNKSIINILFIGLVLSAVIIVMSVMIQKNKKIENEKKLNSELIDRFKDNFYLEELPQDSNSDIKSDTNHSEVLREKLKQEALQIERTKVLESMKEKNLTSELSSNYISGASSEVVSNAVSSNTDYSWHNMEVLTFSTPINTNNTPTKNEKAGPALSIPSLKRKEKFSDIKLDDDETKDITDTVQDSSSDKASSSEKGCSSTGKTTLNNENETTIKINVV